MVKIYVIDNGGQWTHREWRTLRDLNVETKIVPNTTDFEWINNQNVDGIVLSGGSPRIGLTNKLGKCGKYLEKATFPILGICAGHQFMARYFGGAVNPSKIPEFGKIEISVLKKEGQLFEGIPTKSIVWESHNDEVTKLPKEFDLVASSETCKIQAIQHKEKPYFGLQFHPEVEHTVYGVKIFENFIDLCKK
jgi:GMP synthase (glutamine-hydrolysing)